MSSRAPNCRHLVKRTFFTWLPQLELQEAVLVLDDLLLDDRLVLQFSVLGLVQLEVQVEVLRVRVQVHVRLAFEGLVGGVFGVESPPYRLQ